MSEPIIHEGKKYTMDTFLFVVLSVFVLCLSSTLFFVGSYSDAVMALRDDNTKSIHRTNGSDNGLSLLVGGTLIDGTGAPPQPDVSIAIYGSKIIAVTNKTNLTDNLFYNAILGKGKPMILNLTGKYIVPGFFDMHAHVAGVRKGSYDLENSLSTLQMLLNHGVTTTRNPGGPTNESISLKEGVSNGTTMGPEIFTAGTLLNTPEISIPFVEQLVTSEEDVRTEVRRQAAAGVDYIKLYVGLTPDLVRATIDEAHMLGIKVIGHLYLTSWTEAADFGIDALTHGVPVSPLLLPPDKQEIFTQSGGGPFDHSLWLDLVDLNSKEFKAMIDGLLASQVPVDPTLDVYEAILGHGGDPENELRWGKVLQIARMMYDSGVKILSGTDIPNFGLVPGESLHHELQLLTEAGIKPIDVIKIATSNGAEALGIINQTGTIEPGKQADIVILSKNPLEDIGNTRSIDAVIADGRSIVVGRIDQGD
jgi:imidazolonepropionase-like amidohydrolase